MPPRPLAPGARIGPWVVERALGRGAMGAVVVARHPQTKQVRALKVLLVDDPARRERFVREGQALARLERAPNVVRVHSLDQDERGPYLVMELVEGEPLDQVLARGPLAIERAAAIVREVARGLAACHAQGIIHRDVKPANIIVGVDDAPTIVDFGVARDLDARTMTLSGVLVGTPQFMAPEQVDSRHAPIGPATDVWALGALLHTLLVGRPPFDGATLSDVVARLMSARIEGPSAERPEVPRALDDLVRRCMQRRPAQRPSVDQVLAVLEAPHRAVAPARRRGLLALATLASLVAAGGALALRRADAPAVVTSSTPPSAPWARWLGDVVHHAGARVEVTAVGDDLLATADAEGRVGLWRASTRAPVLAVADVDGARGEQRAPLVVPFGDESVAVVVQGTARPLSGPAAELMPATVVRDVTFVWVGLRGDGRARHAWGVAADGRTLRARGASWEPAPRERPFTKVVAVAVGREVDAVAGVRDGRSVVAVTGSAEVDEEPAPEESALEERALFDRANRSAAPVETVTREWEVQGLEGAVSALALGADDRRLVLLDAAGRLQVVEVPGVRLRSMRLTARAPVAADAVAIALPGAEDLLVALTRAGGVDALELWDVGSGVRLERLALGGRYASLAVLPGDRAVALGRDDGVVELRALSLPSRTLRGQALTEPLLPPLTEEQRLRTGWWATELAGRLTLDPLVDGWVVARAGDGRVRIVRATPAPHVVDEWSGPTWVTEQGAVVRAVGDELEQAFPAPRVRVAMDRFEPAVLVWGRLDGEHGYVTRDGQVGRAGAPVRRGRAQQSASADRSSTWYYSGAGWSSTLAGGWLLTLDAGFRGTHVVPLRLIAAQPLGASMSPSRTTVLRDRFLTLDERDAAEKAMMYGRDPHAPRLRSGPGGLAVCATPRGVLLLDHQGVRKLAPTPALDVAVVDERWLLALEEGGRVSAWDVRDTPRSGPTARVAPEARSIAVSGGRLFVLLEDGRLECLPVPALE